MATIFRIDPRIRAYGKARIDVTIRAKDEQDWQKLWKQPRYGFPFDWGDSWKHCIEYKVDDFAAEVGFFIDYLGLPVAAFSPSYAMFTSPGQDFFFSFSSVQEGEQSTPPDTLRMQFRVRDIQRTVEELEERGIIFENRPDELEVKDTMKTCCFRSPHGICIELLGIPEDGSSIEEEVQDQDPDPATQELDFSDSMEEEFDSDLDGEEDDLGEISSSGEPEDELEDEGEDEDEDSEQDIPEDEPRYEDEEDNEEQISFLSPLDKIRESKLHPRNTSQSRTGFGSSLGGRYSGSDRADGIKPGGLKHRRFPFEN